MEIKKEAVGLTIGENVYVLVDDYIFKGDHYLLLPENKIKKANTLLKPNPREWKKIVATTDTDLIDNGLPNLNLDFVEKYYTVFENNGNNDIKLFVEYENDYAHKCTLEGNICTCNGDSDKCDTITFSIPKVYDNNCVFCMIQPKKDTFSREEVLDMLEKYDREFKIDSFAYKNPVSYTVEDWLERQE